jgi:hypothetical protein
MQATLESDSGFSRTDERDVQDGTERASVKACNRKLEILSFTETKFLDPSIPRNKSLSATQ